MAAKKVGTLIKEARTAAGMTQEQLARRVTGASASDISAAERGEGQLTQAQLKQVAKATGVTQASLINAAKGSTPAKQTTAAKKTTTAKKSTTPAFTASMRVSQAEKRLVELYRSANSEQKKAALHILKGDSDSLLDNINGSGGLADTIQDLLGNLFGK